MGAVDFLVLGIILAVLGFVAWFIYRSKKSGKKCIGCPDSCACSEGNCSGGCGSCSQKH